MGYDGVEFAGLYGHEPQEIKAICDSIGLVPVSTHAPYNDLIKNPVGVISQYAQLGCKYIAVPYLSTDCRPGHANFKYVIEFIGILGKAAKEQGIQLLYHNHDFEFIKIDGKYALDIMYESIPADVLATELDTCWVNVGGEEPCAYLRKYAGRAPVIHLKDFWGEKSDNKDESSGNAPQRPANFEFRPLGQGLQNVPALLEAARDAGAEWLIVEQDSPSKNMTPMECIKASIDYLKGINN
ncbi:MAG: sugar phosphate isomerase/epimerase [Clostridia bacterium]|nr:sugar phosphate isomerase/epimerase [Clostridia bacterium]